MYHIHIVDSRQPINNSNNVFRIITENNVRSRTNQRMYVLILSSQELEFLRVYQ